MSLIFVSPIPQRLILLDKTSSETFFRDWPQNMKLLLVVEIPTSQNRHYRDVYLDWMISLHVLGVFMKTSNKLCNPIMAKWSYTFWSFCVGTFDWGMVSSGPQVCTYGTCLSRSVIKLCSCKLCHFGGNKNMNPFLFLFLHCEVWTLFRSKFLLTVW